MRKPAKAKKKPEKIVPTSHALAAMRRAHGGVWEITFAVDGYDQMFTQYVGLKISQPFAVACGKRAVASLCGVSVQDVYLNEIKRA